MSCLGTSVWNNNKLTVSTKITVYRACVLDTMLYGSESWTLYCCQECRLNVFHMHQILGITWYDHVSNKSILVQADIPSMCVLLTQPHGGWSHPKGHALRWIGHWLQTYRKAPLVATKMCVSTTWGKVVLIHLVEKLLLEIRESVGKSTPLGERLREDQWEVKRTCRCQWQMNGPTA